MTDSMDHRGFGSTGSVSRDRDFVSQRLQLHPTGITEIKSQRACFTEAYLHYRFNS